MNLGLKKLIESEEKEIRERVESFLKEMAEKNKRYSVFNDFDYDKHLKIFDEIAENEEVDITICALDEYASSVSVEIEVKRNYVGKARFIGKSYD